MDAAEIDKISAESKENTIFWSELHQPFSSLHPRPQLQSESRCSTGRIRTYCCSSSPRSSVVTPEYVLSLDHIYLLTQHTTINLVLRCAAPAHRLRFLAVLCLAGSVSKMPPSAPMPLVLSACRVYFCDDWHLGPQRKMIQTTKQMTFGQHKGIEITKSIRPRDEHQRQNDMAPAVWQPSCDRIRLVRTGKMA